MSKGLGTCEQCRFCVPPDRDRILYSGGHFYVMLSLGPIVEGYLLIISKEHFGSYSELPEDQVAEFSFLKEKVGCILREEYGSVLFFEHGRVGTCNQEAGDKTHCFHAHLHCVPLTIRLGTMVEKELEARKFGAMQSALKFAKTLTMPYLLIDDSHVRVFPVLSKLRNQYLRCHIAEALGTPHLGDWLAFPGRSLINQGKARLLPYFENIR